MTAIAPLPRSRARLPWAWVPVALLLSSALGVGSMALIAVRDPNFATEPDYYQKAIHWNRSQAQAGTNQRLGYQLELPAQLRFDKQGHALIELSIIDRLGHEVRGAQLSGEAFANAFSGEIVGVAFDEQSPGRYLAKLTVHHSGQWVFQIAGDSGAGHFTATLRADLVPGGAA